MSLFCYLLLYPTPPFFLLSYISYVFMYPSFIYHYQLPQFISSILPYPHSPQHQAEHKIKYDEVMSRIKTSTDLAAARDCDLIIEAIIENEDIKNAFYKVLHNDSAMRELGNTLL